MGSLDVLPSAFLSEMRAEASWGVWPAGAVPEDTSHKWDSSGLRGHVPDTSEVALNVAQGVGCSLESCLSSLRPVFFVVLPLENEVLVAVW